MKELNGTGKFTDQDWIDLASLLSDDREDPNDLLNRFTAEDTYNTVENWKELEKMSSEEEINVDKAWSKVQQRLIIDGLHNDKRPVTIRIIRSNILRVAAAAVILLSVGLTALYLGNNDILSKRITLVTNSNEKNLLVSLPDGSRIVLNRNTELSYLANFGKQHRDVKLKGEAFFDIAPDKSKPFIIDAGNARVKVVGTSFNVKTNDSKSAVEVYVKTGKVLLLDNSGSNAIELDPEYVGSVNIKGTAKELNKNPNYLAWKTEKLFYNGQKLDIVFNDLKRVYNMDIIADDVDIKDNIWTSPIDTQSQDTIIRLICTSFNLSYTKDGTLYHLRKK